jgi:hypothetical protein
MIKITITGEKEISSKFSEAPKVIRQTITSAMTKTMKRMEKDLETAAAKEFDIPKPVLAKWRIKSKRVGTNGLVWMGYNPIKSGYIGILRQEDWGASARSYFFKGGFVATMNSGHKGIFMRAGKGRKPIREQKVSLLKAPILAAQVKTRANEYYQQEIATQLVYKLTK